MGIGDYGKGTDARTTGGEGTRADKPGSNARSSQREAGDAEARRARLVRTIEGEIVPRLVLARRVVREDGATGRDGYGAPDETDVLELVRLLMRTIGVSRPPMWRRSGSAARRSISCVWSCWPRRRRELGRLWEEEECDFMQVTFALCRLHQAVARAECGVPVRGAERELQRRILLAPCPGEQHTFGFRWWSVSTAGGLGGLAGVSRHQRRDFGAGRQNWFAVVGLSVGGDLQAGRNRADDSRDSRALRRNREVGVLWAARCCLRSLRSFSSSVQTEQRRTDRRQCCCAEHFCVSRRAATGDEVCHTRGNVKQFSGAKKWLSDMDSDAAAKLITVAVGRHTGRVRRPAGRDSRHRRSAATNWPRH